MADGAGPMPVGRDDGDPVPGGVPRSALANELLLGLEPAGLAAFAFSRTVLDAFGRSPESFVVRGASGAEVVTFGFIVPPDRFREGGNVLSAFEVTGPVGGETLLPLTVRSDG